MKYFFGFIGSILLGVAIGIVTDDNNVAGLSCAGIWSLFFGMTYGD